MAFTQALRIALIERFAPIVFLHKDEPDFPVSPVDYLEHSALWSSTPPDHPRTDWGLPSGSGRRPLIPRSGISLNPDQDVGGTADPDGDGVPEHYLGERGAGGFPFLKPRSLELWLDFAGWHDSRDVTAASTNQRTTLERRRALRQPCFMAEVWTLKEWRDQIGPEEVLHRFGIAPNQEPQQLVDLAVISYYFLFPLHLQPRSTTALAAPDDPDTGNYEGDWTSFAVVVRVPRCDCQDPAVDQFEPKYGAFGHRWRGAGRDFEEHALNRMVLRQWSSLVSVNDHAVVQAAHGTHNLYPHDAPTNDSGGIKPQEGFGDSLSGAGNKFVQDSVEQPGAAGLAAVTALKIAAGWGIAGPFGALVGAIAAAAEAAAAEEEGIVDVPEVEPSDAPADGDLDADADSEESGLSTQSRVALPSGIGDPPFADAGQADIQVWSFGPLEALGEIAAPLLFPASPRSPRFEGRWGVRCVDDPHRRRTGIRFPEYRHQVMDALLAQT